MILIKCDVLECDTIEVCADDPIGQISLVPIGWWSVERPRVSAPRAPARMPIVKTEKDGSIGSAVLAFSPDDLGPMPMQTEHFVICPKHALPKLR